MSSYTPVYEKGENLDFPDSVVEFFRGMIGKPYQGFPKELQRIILKGKEEIPGRPGEQLKPVNFEALKEQLYEKLNRQVTPQEMVRYALYPKVFLDYEKFGDQYGDVSVLDTPSFVYGLRLGEEISVEIEQGKTLIIKLVSIGEPQKDGTRVVYFELNGQPREVVVRDESIQDVQDKKVKVDPDNPKQIGASMPGTVVEVLVKAGEHVNKNDYLMITESMKMETTVQAPFEGTVKRVEVKDGEALESGDLLIEFE